MASEYQIGDVIRATPNGHVLRCNEAGLFVLKTEGGYMLGSRQLTLEEVIKLCNGVEPQVFALSPVEVEIEQDVYVKLTFLVKNPSPLQCDVQQLKESGIGKPYLGGEIVDVELEW